MFQGVLEKVFLNVVGPFVNGIDQNTLKVGVWSGNVSVQNISLKPEVVHMMELPIQMKYSSIGKLSLSIPWKHLGSKPVELIIEDVHVLLQPRAPEFWGLINLNNPEQKLKMMDAFVQKYAAKLAQKRSQSKGVEQIMEKDKGLVSRLVEKAIDNIQISVRNIHIRFEDPLAKSPYAFGLSLDEIRVHTTNEDWQEDFIDRTIAENKLLPMRKLFLLKNFGIYWNSESPELYGEMLPTMIGQKMREKILRYPKAQEKLGYIIDLSAEGRLTQKNYKNAATRDDPDFDLVFQVAPVEVLLKKTQVDGMVYLIEFINKYQKFRYKEIARLKREIGSYPETQVETYREEFRILFEKIMQNDQQEGLKSMNNVADALDGPEEATFFEELISKLPNDDIGTIMKGSLKKLETERVMKEMTEEKEKSQKKSKSKRKAIVGWIKNKVHRKKENKKEEQNQPKKQEESFDSSSTFWDNEEMEKIEKYIEESFSDEEMEATDYRNFIRFKFLLPDGMVYLCHELSSGHEEGMTIEIKQLVVDTNFTSQTTKVQVNLQDFGFNLRTKYSTSYSYLDSHIIRRVNYWLPAERRGSLISLNFEKNPLGKKDGSSLDLKVDQLEIVYRSALINRLKRFFAEVIDNQALKSQFEKAETENPEPIGKPEEPKPINKQYISVDIRGPVLVMPLLQNGDIKSECWVLNLGHLVIGSMDPMTNEGLLYDIFNLALNDVRFEYYPSHALYMKIQQSSIENSDLSLLDTEEIGEYRNVFNMIEKFNVSVKLQKMLPGMENTEDGKGLPKINVQVSVPIVNLQVKPSTYKNLLKLPDIFDFKAEAEMTMIQNEKSRLLLNNDMMGSLYVQERKLGKKVWTKCQCILQDNYLYLYKHSEDQTPSFTYYIMKASLSDCEGTEKKFAFSLHNKHNKACLAAETQEEKEEWSSALADQIDKVSAPNIFQRSKTLKRMKTKKFTEQEHEEETKVSYETVEMKLWFEIKEVKLTLFQTDLLDKKLVEVDTKNFQVDLQKQPSMQTVSLRLESLEVVDHLFKFTNPNLKNLVTSIPPIETNLENADLIEVNIVNIQQDHPKYEETMTNLQIHLKFGYLYVNLKPDVISEVMRVLLAPAKQKLEESQKSLQRQKTQEMPKVKKETTYTENITNILLHIQINFREVGLRLVHAKTHVCMAEMALKEMSFMLNQRPYSTEFQGVLGNIQLFDTTNFPNTIDSNIEYEKINKYELIGVEEKSKNLMQLTFKQYSPEHPDADAKTHKYTFIDLTVNSIRINYLHKPIMRLINYITGQIVTLVTPIRDAVPKQENDQIINEINEEEIQKKLKNPTFVELKISISSPIICIKPLPETPEYWEIRVGDVSITTDAFPDYTRLENAKNEQDFLYCERYNITLRNMGVFRSSNIEKSQLTQEIKLDLTVESPMFIPEYTKIFKTKSQAEEGETTMDPNIIIKGRITPLIAALDHQDVLLLMKIIKTNMIYDDKMDDMYLSAPIESKSKAQSKAQDIKKKEPVQQSQSVPLSLDFMFESFTLLTLDEAGLPFAMINLHVLNIDVDLNQDGAMKGSIGVCALNGTYFEKTQTTLTEKKMLGAFDRASEHYINGKRPSSVTEGIISSLEEYVHQLANNYNETHTQFNLRLEFQPNGKKLISADLKEVKALLVPDIYSGLLSFIDTEQTMSLLKEKESQQQDVKLGQDHPEELTKTEEQPKSQLPTVSEGSLRIELTVTNILITVPASKLSIRDSPYLLALRGDILCGLDLYSAPTLEKALVGIKDKEFERAIDQCTEENEIMHFKATLNKFEMFICEYEELITSRNLSEVRKRNIILPFTWSFTRKANLVPNKLKTDLISVAKNSASLEVVICRVSYQDALVLNNTIEYQLEQLNVLIKESQKAQSKIDKKDQSLEDVSEMEVESIKMSGRSEGTSQSFEESKEDPRELVNETISTSIQELNENQDDWEQSFEAFEAEIQGIQMVLINDAEGTLVPVIEITLQDIIAQVSMANKKVIARTLVHMSCSYFNPLPSKWEPIIERYGFQVQVGLGEDPKLSLIIATEEAYDTLNINVSEEMLRTLYSTISTFKADYERKILKRDKNNLPKVELVGYSNEENTGVEVEDELIDYVYPYILVNMTGYPIEVETDTTHQNIGTSKRPSFSRSRSKKLKELINKVYEIPNQERMQYLIESNIDELFTKTIQETTVGVNHISVKIRHPDFGFESVTGIDIDRPQLTAYKLKGRDKTGEPYTAENLRLYADISMDNNTKVITLCSPFKIINRTQAPYTVVLEGSQKTAEINLEPGAIAPVPIDLMDATVSLKGNDDTLSIKRLLKEFATKEIEQVELQTGSSFVLLESVKKDEMIDYYEISLLPTFTIRNCCGLEVSYRITADIDDDPVVRKLKPQESLQEGRVSMRQNVFLQLRMQGFLWSEKVPIYKGDVHTHSKPEDEIILRDATGASLSIHLFHPHKEPGTRKFLLYTKACIINETPYDLRFFVPGDQKKIPLPGQIPVDENEDFNPKVMLVNETKRLAISRKGHNEHSGIINVGSVGSSFVELNEEHHNTMLELGLDMNVVQCDKEYKLLTKIITVSPRYILVNKTNQELEIKRDEGQKQSLVLHQDSREAFQWSDWGSNVQEKSIAIRIRDTENPVFWTWSRGIDITSAGEYHFVAKSQDKNLTKFLKATVTMENSILFVIITEDKGGASFKIRNDCPGIEIRLCQAGTDPSEGIVIKSGTTIPWSWEYPNKRLEVWAEFGIEETGRFTTSGQTFKFASLNHVEKVQMPDLVRDKLRRIFSLVVMEENSRVLTFFTPEKGKTGRKNKAMEIIEEAQKVGRSSAKTKINLSVDVSLRGLGLSLISNLKNKALKRKDRREIAYLWIGGLEAKMIDFDDSMIAQLRVKFLNLDNNLTYDTSFPVLITPENPQELAYGTRNYLLDVLVSQKKANKALYFETIQFLLAELSVKMDGIFIDAILEMANNFTDIFKSSDLFTSNKTIAESLYSDSNEAKSLENLDNFNSKFSWMSRPLPEMKSNIFIRQLILHPIFINLSFQLKKLDMAENINFLVNLFANSFGSTIANLDNAPLKIKGFQLENIFASQEIIIKRILDKVQADAVKSVLKLLGSLDILGNPVGLFNSISTGVVDLIEKPREGFLESPIEGGKGIIAGAGSLVKNTVSGTFNSVGKFTGSLASGMAGLGMDQQYLASREKGKLRRPSHVGEGLYQGVTSLLKGIGYGFKGVISQPVHGAATEGVPGLLKGTAKGLTGLIAKPVAGILDAASKTAEGVKNTATMFDPKPNEMRVRLPRAFYGREKFYRSYTPSDAEIIWLLHQSKNFKYQHLSLIDTFDVFPNENERDNFFILALSYENILCWDIKASKLAWAVDPKEIANLTLYQDAIELDLAKPVEGAQENKLVLRNCDPIQNEYIAQKIATLKHKTD